MDGPFHPHGVAQFTLHFLFRGDFKLRTEIARIFNLLLDKSYFQGKLQEKEISVSDLKKVKKLRFRESLTYDLRNYSFGKENP